MDIVLGVSMAPKTVQMVLVEGENADGATVDDEDFEVAPVDGSTTSGAADQVVAAILGTRESAAEADYRLASTGVVWTDPVEATALRDALATHKVENVMLVSAFMSAAALAQAAGSAVGYAYTGLLFLEPDTATLAIIDSADGSIVDVRRESMHVTDALAELPELVARFDTLKSSPDGLFVVGCGVDVTEVRPQLETATALPVSAPDEPETALARGAALASANAPLFTSSTSALAYAQVPDWTTAEVVDPFAIVRGFADVAALQLSRFGRRRAGLQRQRPGSRGGDRHCRRRPRRRCACRRYARRPQALPGGPRRDDGVLRRCARVGDFGGRQCSSGGQSASQRGRKPHRPGQPTARAGAAERAGTGAGCSGTSARRSRSCSCGCPARSGTRAGGTGGSGPGGSGSRGGGAR